MAFETCHELLEGKVWSENEEIADASVYELDGGLDLAESVFQAHGIDESGVTVLVKKLQLDKYPLVRS